MWRNQVAAPALEAGAFGCVGSSPSIRTNSEKFMNNPHIGSKFIDFLLEENILKESTEVAVARIEKWQEENIPEHIRKNGV